MSTPAFVSGNITSTPQLAHTQRRHPGGEPVLAENTRRLGDGEWADGTTIYWEVVCCGPQAENIAASLPCGARGRHVPHPHLARRRRRRAVPVGDRRLPRRPERTCPAGMRGWPADALQRSTLINA
jgi:hypothetical protein